MDAPTMLAKRIEDINQNTRSLITVYMQWYTFYWTLNSVALAWFWSKSPAGPGSGFPPSLVMWFFAVMALPSGTSSFMVLKSVMEMRSEVEKLNRHLAAAINLNDVDPIAVALRPATWPAPVTRWGISVNGITTFALGVIWIYLALR
jgi:hypothetical protein